MADPEWKRLPVIQPTQKHWKELPTLQPSEPSGPPEVSGAESGLQGFGQGASFGFSDELAGLAHEGVKGQSTNVLRLLKTAPGRALLRSIWGEGSKRLPDVAIDAIADEAADQGAERVLGSRPRSSGGGGLPAAGYAMGRNQARRDIRVAEKSNPNAYFAGQIAGAVASPGPKGLGAGKLAKQGAGYGALAGAGLSEGDITKGELAPIAIDSALGAGTGAVMTPVASGLSARFGRFLKGKSQENALRAVGARAGISDVLGSQGVKTADDARRLGQVAIDKELVPPFSKASDVAENTGFALEREGARIDAVLRDADAVAAESAEAIKARNAAAATEGPFWWKNPDAPPPNFDFDAASWRATQEVMGPDGLTAEAMSKAKPAASIVDRMLKQGEIDPTFAAANRLKSNIYEGINYGTDPALTTRMQQDAARGLKKSIEEQVEQRLGAEAAEELRAANRGYGDLKTIQSLSSEAARRQMGQVGALSPGMVAASVAAGSPLPMMTKAASPYIPSTLSWLQRTASPAMLPLAQSAVKPTVQRLTEEEEDAIQAFLQSP